MKSEALSAVLAGQPIAYRLVRVRRRTIGFVIDDQGLTVRAPLRVSRRDIAEAVIQKADWIVRTLAKWAKREKLVPPEAWHNGATVLFRGQPLQLLIEPARQNRVEQDLFALHVRLRDTAAEQVATAVQRWLETQARLLLRERLDVFSAKLGLPPPIARFTRAHTQWGSCNAKGVIRLHWRLIQLPPTLADYVVAHEVAHRVELNHSPRFWAAVETIFPNCKRARRELERYGELLS